MFLLALAGKPALAAAPAEAEPQAPADFTVLADESLRIPLTRIARDYTVRTKASLTLWFASAGRMTDSIREGADADIVITADDDALKALEFSGQIDVYATQAIVSSPLVLAVVGDTDRKGREAGLGFMNWRYRDGAPLRLVVIDATHSLEQRLSEQALTRSELLRARSLAPVHVATSAQAIAAMKREDIPGLLLAVDVFSRENLQVAQRFSTVATYKAAVLAGERMAASRDFIAWLHSEEARLLFTQFGLSAVE